MSIRRRGLSAVVAIASALLATGVAQAQTKWDLSTVWPDGNFHTKNAMRFADEVKKATNGAVEITVKAGGQLGFKGPEHLRAVRDGLVPMADILNIQQIGDEPVLGTEGMPFLVGSADELKVLHKYLRPSIREGGRQEQSEDHLHGALADAVSASQGQGRHARRPEGHQDPRSRQGRGGHVDRGRHVDRC